MNIEERRGTRGVNSNIAFSLLGWFQIWSPLKTAGLSPAVLISKITTIAVAVVTVIHW